MSLCEASKSRAVVTCVPVVLSRVLRGVLDEGFCKKTFGRADELMWVGFGSCETSSC
jgi:hypothetical protein